MAEHPTSGDFVVNPGTSSIRSDMMTEAIKRIEPALRSQGKAINWDVFNRLFMSGELNNLETPEAVTEALKKFG